MVELYVIDIANALRNKCYFSALALSLALPDICGAAEYPNETSTAKRYIEWYNKYLGEYMSNEEDTPFLSGEVVYNLRNTFLHTGSPNIDSSKVKNERNQLDKFQLLLGDGTILNSMTMFIDTPLAKLRTMTVDITYLCQTICDCSLWYYKQNPKKFQFDFLIDTQENLLSNNHNPPSGNPIVEAVNQKLKQKGDNRRFDEYKSPNPIESIVEGYKYILSDDDLKQKYFNGEEITLVRDNPIESTSVPQTKQTPTEKKQTVSKTSPKTTSKQKKSKPDKRESQIRSFFGQHFKEKKYQQKKEVIIQAVLKSKTKQQVNNTLMKSFTSEDTGVIYKRLAPLLKSIPGK